MRIKILFSAYELWTSMHAQYGGLSSAQRDKQ